LTERTAAPTIKGNTPAGSHHVAVHVIVQSLLEGLLDPRLTERTIVAGCVERVLAEVLLARVEDGVGPERLDRIADRLRAVGDHPCRSRLRVELGQEVVPRVGGLIGRERRQPTARAGLVPLPTGGHEDRAALPPLLVAVQVSVPDADPEWQRIEHEDARPVRRRERPHDERAELVEVVG